MADERTKKFRTFEYGMEKTHNKADETVLTLEKPQ